MKTHNCVTSDGEHFELHQDNQGIYLCPVCGSAEHEEPPYYENGSASFNMCSCGFEFGFDDSNLASKDAVKGIVKNWDRWRVKVVEKNKLSKTDLKRLELNLSKIGYKLAFDLIPVKSTGGT